MMAKNSNELKPSRDNPLERSSLLTSDGVRCTRQVLMKGGPACASAPFSTLVVNLRSEAG